MSFNFFNPKRFLVGTVAAAALLVTPVALRVANSAAEAQRNEAPLAELNLTEAQQAEIQTIRDVIRSQVEGVLTDAQRQQLAATLQSGEGGLRGAMRSLDLSDEQRQQLRAIHDASQDAVQAVLTSEQQQQVEQMRQERQANGRSRMNATFEQLDLTEDQQAQMATIRSNARSQIEAILTDEQRQQAEAALQADDGNLRQALRAANLTDEQQQQIRLIMESSRDAAFEVLTPEQQQQLEQMRQQGPRGDRPQRLQHG